MGKTSTKAAGKQPNTDKANPLAAENTQLKKELAQALKTNAELQKQNENAKKEKSTGNLSVIRKGMTYDIVYQKMRLDGKIITAQQVKEDAALADRLIAMGSGMLKKRISKS